MKKIIILAAMTGIFWGCDQDEYMVYEDDARLQFGPTPDKIYTQQSEWEDTVKTFSVFVGRCDKMLDTVILIFTVLDVVSTVERRYELEQVDD